MKTLIVTTAIQIESNDFYYLETSRKLIDSYINLTDFDILILTNNVEYYKFLKNDRIRLFDYNETFNEPIKSSGKFNMHIKRLAIKLGCDLNYDIIYHHDCDCYIDGWDQQSYDELVEQDYDVIFPTSETPQLGELRKTYQHFQDKINNEFVGLYYDELDLSPNPAETRIIFKNNQKLKTFLDFWDKISKNNKNYLTYNCGVYFGTSAKHSNMKMYSVKKDMDFSKYGKIKHRNKTLNYFGVIINE
jgi:hypothetical protein